ncbi:hypothetical protein [Microlunatus antarcticus]|uniref:Uncharacterized protein n=1 Tax=Microlunatus antarcticus TaxID=53388 RepID=A0A7W5P7S4_9ACTN|nr:hypothetical protein [Microlunatus antarcticus]MBB3327186.1 hypothetical protein [Microlunatus antarcticus]
MRPLLPVLAAGTVAAAALLVPSAASADTHVAWPPASPHHAQSRIVDSGNDITWRVDGHKVTLTSATEVEVPITYTCGTKAAPEDRQYGPGVFQTTFAQPTAAAFNLGDPSADPTFTCDGHKHLIKVSVGSVGGPISPTPPPTGSGLGGFERGNIEVGLYRISNNEAPATFQHAIVGHDNLNDKRAKVTVAINATPESTKAGKKITVKGTVKRNGHAYKGKEATLYFQSKTGTPAQPVGTDEASSKGNLSTKITVTGPGTYFWVTDSTSKTQAGASFGDYAAAGTH